jgi:hypothetical protein
MRNSTSPRTTFCRVDFLIEGQLGKAFVAAVGDGAARGSPGKHVLLDLYA